ncbi:PEGA domain-containing protein [Candidatus Micrarchaeota archaeon]|nr:PEGA domain-containing protein [Candidatus Micrarchaeota archaeon]
MYEMLCGAVPFKGDTQLKTLLMHRDAPPIPPSRRMGGPDISMGVEAIVLKALAKKPENRFQTMERMRIAIENDGKATNLDDVRLGEAFAAMSRTGGYEESDVGYSYTEQTTPILKKSRRGMKTVGILLASAVVACGAYFHEPILQKMRELVDTYIGQEEREQVPYQIRIETEPGGADVYIEEEIAGANRLRLLGNTPISQRMPVGEHTLIIRKRRYEDARIVVSSENNEHQIELQRR